MRRFKIVSVLLAAVLVLGLFAGCGKTDKTTSTTTSKSTSTPASTAEAEKTVDKSPVTLTFYNADLNFDIDFTDPVAKKITELTGVTLKFQHPVGGDTQGVPLMIASGEYPDLIYAKGDTGKLVDAGALEKLDPYFEKSGTNLKNLYGDFLKRLRYGKDDQSIYTVGTYGVSTAAWAPSGTMQLQNAVLKELGYPKINTIKDYEDALRKYVAKYPEIDGQKTIGLSLMGSDWRWLITVGNTASSAIGIPDDGQWKIDDSIEEATYKFVLPEIKEFFKWLNKLNADGLLDPESFTQKYDSYIAKLSSGRVIGIADATWDYGDATKALLAANKPERTYVPLPVVVNESYKNPTLKNYGYGGGWGIGISSTSKNKERAFQFLDWVASDEAQVLLNWGIEGVNYKVENGKRVVPADEQQKKNTDKDYSKKTGVGLYVYPLPQRGDGAKDPTGNYYTTNSEENIINNYNAAEKETLSGYGIKMWTDFFPRAEELGVSKHGQAWQYNVPSDGDLAIIQKKADDYTQKAITNAILSKPEEFDAAWDKIQSDLKEMGIDKANTEMTKLTKEKIALWNE